MHINKRFVKQNKLTILHKISMCFACASILSLFKCKIIEHLTKDINIVLYL